MAWKSAGYPTEGPLFDEKSRLRSAVRKKVRRYADKSERLRDQRRDKLFATRDGRRFVTLQRKNARCSKLVVDGETIQDPERLLQIRVGHFGKLAESRLGEVPDGVEQSEKMEMLESQSHMNEEYLFDVAFTAEEVSRAVSKLKKAPDPDGL